MSKSRKNNISMIVPYHKGEVRFDNLTKEQCDLLIFYSESLYGRTIRKSAQISVKI